MPESLTTVLLFGGAMQCCIPKGYKDVSDIRQVPDNQEVFVDIQSENSLIVEILEYQSSLSDDSAISFFFEDLCKENSVESSEVLISRSLTEESVLFMPKEIPKIVLSGKQRFARNDATQLLEHSLQVAMALFRLERYNADILVTLNCPDTPTNTRRMSPEESLELLCSAIHNFDIKNFDIFT